MPTINTQSMLTLTSNSVRNNCAGITTKDVLEESILVGKSRTGTAVKGWKRIIESGGNATSSVLASEIVQKQIMNTSVSYAGSGAIKCETGSLSGAYGLSYIPFVPDGSVLSTLSDRATVKAVSNLRSGFNTFTFFGELREALIMIRNPALALRRHATSQVQLAKYLRTKSKTLNAYRKAIAGSWLEFQFGWKPLASDIYNAVEAYNKVCSQRLEIPFKSTFKQTVSTPRTRVASGNPVSPFHFDKYVSQKTDYSVSIQGKATLASNVSPSKFNFGATIPDFVPTAWELMPWSFVIDYFTNIGDILNTSATLRSVNFTYISHTARALNKQYVDLWWSSNTSVLPVGGTSGFSTWELKSINRSSLDTLKVPSFQASRNLSLLQSLNLTALINARDLDRNYRR